MQFQRKVLENGLRLLTVPMPSFESATVLVMVGAGSRYETKQNNGISHFLEHMAFKGTKKRPSALEISSLIDGMGGEFNAFTGKEATGFYIKSSVNRIETSFDVISDMLQNSLFDPKEIEKERGVILEEINLYEDTPMRKIGDIFEQLLYGDTPMGWDIAGEKDVIKKVQRGDFMDYMSKLYSADNITIALAGGTTFERNVLLAKKYFSRMKRFKTVSYPKIAEDQKSPKVFIKHKKTEQAHLAIGFRTVPNDHPDKYSLSVLSAVLGGGMSSRLFHQVRERRGLAYYVRSNTDSYRDCGSFASFAGLDPKRIKEAIKVILHEHGKIANINKIPDKELKKAKEYLKGHLVLEMEDSRSVAAFYAQQELLEKEIDNLDIVLEKIEKVASEDVVRVAKKYFVNNNLNLAIIGDFTSGQEFEKLLQLV